MSVLSPHHQGVTVSDCVDSAFSTWAGRSLWLEASWAVSSTMTCKARQGRERAEEAGQVGR